MTCYFFQHLSLGEQWARGEGPHTPDPVMHCSVVFGTPVDVFLVLHQVSVGVDAGVIWDRERETANKAVNATHAAPLTNPDCPTPKLVQHAQEQHV